MSLQTRRASCRRNPAVETVDILDDKGRPDPSPEFGGSVIGWRG